MDDSRSSTWAVVRTVLGAGMVVGLFLPWLGGCVPQSGVDLLTTAASEYHATSDYGTVVARFPGWSDKAALVAMFASGVIVFGVGALAAGGLLNEMPGVSIVAGLIGSCSSLWVLARLIMISIRSSLEASIAVGSPIVFLCSTASLIAGLGEKSIGRSPSTGSNGHWNGDW